MNQIDPVKPFDSTLKSYHFKGFDLWYHDVEFPNVYGMRMVIEDFDLYDRVDKFRNVLWGFLR